MNVEKKRNRVIIKTNTYNFCGVQAGDIGTIVQETKNYYDEQVFDVRVKQAILRFSKNEVELENEV